MSLQVGDNVQVEGEPVHGRVQSVDGEHVVVEFPMDGGYEHSRVQPYHVSKVKKA